MNKFLNIDTLDNPSVKVIWEDTPENFTQERFKSVKQYFQKKYATNNINICTKVKNIEDESEQTVDVAVNVMDKSYQTTMVESYLKSKGYDVHFDAIMDLDKEVDNVIMLSEETGIFKNWFIKKIEFSNFLSYGENQVLDFEKCNGITVIESNPENFGGKSVLSIDLPLFLFFNTTTKTNKAEEIFNRYTDNDRVEVKGEITIDGEDYLIVRTLERKKSKSGEISVKTDLDFFKILPNGELQNFTGEQRRETEKFIKTSIGEQEDFLMTILTTGANLEDLIDSKPTTRGQVLAKFLGLESLRRKEDACKVLFTEYSKGMLSNIYNSETLKQEINSSEAQILKYQDDMKEAEFKIGEINSKLEIGKEYKENILKSKHTDIDHELVITNPDAIEKEIDTIIKSISNTKHEISNVDMTEPSSYYHEDEHEKVKADYNEKYKTKVYLDNKLNEIKKLKSLYGDGVKCEHCGIDILNASLIQSKIAENDEITTQYELNNVLMNELSDKDTVLINLKKQFDTYEKNKLIKSRLELTLESNELKKSKLDDKLKRYFEIQEKIKQNIIFDEQLIKANMRISDLEKEKRIFDNILVTNGVQIKSLTDKIIKNNDYIYRIEKEFEKEKIYKIYGEVYGKNGITKIVMKTMVPLINSELQRLLQDSSLFRLEIRISGKNEVEFWMIDNNTGIEKLMISGSGYEKTIASLALRAVLSKVCSLPKPNIIVFDEIFGKVANNNLELVWEFFKKIKEYFEKILLITHNPLVTNWADSVIKIDKINNISNINQ